MLAVPEVNRKWFVLLCEPQMERKAAAHLIARRFKTYLPEETVFTTRGVRRRKVPVRRPMFRGYLFIRLSFLADGERWNVVTTVPGVHRFLRFVEDYAIVPDDQMQRIYGTEQILATPKKISGPSSIFAAGEQIRISDGPFSGLNAEIEKLDDDERITVLLSLLGSIARVHLPAEQLEKL